LFIEHVRAPVDSTKAGEGLGEFSEPVEGVDVRRLAVSGHR
jgi:hypothetical protein